VEKIDWLEPDLLQNLFRWSGLEEETEHSCWKDIGDIIKRAKQSGHHLPRFRDHRQNGVIKADGAAAIKILKLYQVRQHNRNRIKMSTLTNRHLLFPCQSVLVSNPIYP
jgi:hypothetical protein